MTDSLRERLVYACRNVAPLNLSEAEQDNYPYVVYDMTTGPISDKDGVYGYAGDTKIRIVGSDLARLDDIREGIEDAILEMRDSSFFTRLVDTTKECVDGIWTIEQNYSLRQYADWVEPTE